MWRGEVWWSELPLPSGSGPGKRRPVLIVQSDAFNRSRINTRIVAVITSNLKLAEAPGNVRVSADSSGLPKDSIVNASQLITIDKVYLTKKVSKLPVQFMNKVDEGIKLVLSI